MDIKRSKKIHIIVEEEPKRKAAKMPGMPVPKGVSLSDEKLKAAMEMITTTTTGRTTMNTSTKTLLEREKLARFEAQLQNARNTPEQYWTTGDGNRVLITEMKDEHLINTINYLFKKINRDLALYVSDKYLQLLNRYNITERSTMSADTFFEEVKRLEGIEGCKLAFKRFPKLKNLLSEAMGRGLYWQNYKTNKKGAKK